MALLAEGEPQTSAAARLAGKRVLVVEDEAVIALLIEDLLAELGCIVVGPAVRVGEAVRIVCTDDAIDVAILDVNVAGEPVYPVASALAERGRPFVFATGYGESGLSRAFAGHTVLTKPYRRTDLHEALLQAFDHPA